MGSQPAYFWLRTPHLPIERLLNGLSRHELSSFLQDSFIRGAIRLASPVFYSQLETDPNLELNKTYQTALKYILRMGSRATPFGMFAGYEQGQIANETRLYRSDEQPIIHRRLHMAVLEKIYSVLLQQDQILQYGRYFTNSSIYQVGEFWRYVELQQEIDHNHCYVSQIKKNTAINTILRTASKGASRQVLVKLLIKKKYKDSEANWLIEQLIRDQILVSEFSLNVTGLDCLEYTIRLFTQIDGCDEQLQALKQIKDLLCRNNFSLLEERKIYDLLLLNFRIDTNAQPLLYANIQYTNSNLKLNSLVRDTIQNTLEQLRRLAHLNPAQKSLSTFKERFYERYQDREMPLGLVLDPEVGIGYSDITYKESSLINELSPKVNFQEEVVPHNDWLIRQYDKWLDQGGQTLTITKSDLDELPEQPLHLPENYFALGYFLADAAKQIDSRNYKFVLKAAGGVSGFELMGRFCQGDSSLTNLIRVEYLKQQTEKSEYILAEIAHLSHAQAGPVVQRPHLRNFEIPYISLSTLPIKYQIWLSDLYVSVPKGQQIILRSKRLNKEILPRLSTAHDFPNGLPIYRFLGDLQYQSHLTGIKWTWGNLSDLRQLPRVQFRETILQEASWRLDRSDYNSTLSLQANINEWRVRWNWPRCVAIIQTDQELFIDLDSSACQELLVSTLKRLNSLRLIEWLRIPQSCCVCSTLGKMTHEVIIPFTHPYEVNRVPTQNSHNKAIQQIWTPGSEWLQVKVYTNGLIADWLLHKFSELANRCKKKGLINHWFFIRYKDPESHIRFRLRLVQAKFVTTVLQIYHRFFNPLVINGTIGSIKIDTYQRETERYGSHLIDQMEQLFWIDSKAVASLLKNQVTNSQRLNAATLGVNMLVDDFNLNINEKIIFFKKLYESMLNQSNDHTSTRKQLAHEYRKNQNWIIDIISKNEKYENKDFVKRTFKERSQDLCKIIAEMSWKNGEKQKHLANLLHLFINRIFNNEQLVYELLIYHHIYKVLNTIEKNNKFLSETNKLEHNKYTCTTQ